jgi:hypothetical protein
MSVKYAKEVGPARALRMDFGPLVLDLGKCLAEKRLNIPSFGKNREDQTHQIES